MKFDDETPSTFARRIGLVHQRPSRGKGRGTNLNYLTWDDALNLAVGKYWTEWCRRNTR